MPRARTPWFGWLSRIRLLCLRANYFWIESHDRPTYWAITLSPRKTAKHWNRAYNTISNSRSRTRLNRTTFEHYQPLESHPMSPYVEVVYSCARVCSWTQLQFGPSHPQYLLKSLKISFNGSNRRGFLRPKQLRIGVRVSRHAALDLLVHQECRGIPKRTQASHG